MKTAAPIAEPEFDLGPLIVIGAGLLLALLCR